MSTAAAHHLAWRALPVGTLDEIIGRAPWLILAPHPDDESLGCGGLIATAVAAGRPPLLVMLTDGTGSHPGSRDYPAERLRTVREAEALEAAGCLGLPAERVVFLRERDTAVPVDGARFDAIVSRLRGLAVGYGTILAPWQHDPHCDHAAASLIARALGLRHVAYPVWGWTLPGDFAVPGTVPLGWRLNVRRHMAAKQRAIRAHQSQFGGLITDDPDGFQLPEALLSVFAQPFETFLRP